MANIIWIIRRAVCFDCLSSLSKASRTWQNSHSTPNDAVKSSECKIVFAVFRLLSPGKRILHALEQLEGNQRFAVAAEADASGLSGGGSGTRAVIPLPSVIE